MTTYRGQAALRASLQASVAIAGTHPAIATADRAAIRFWSLLSGITMVAGIVYAFFGGWYWAIVGMVAWFVIATANRKSAAQLILATAANDPVFESEMLQRGILIRR